MGKHAAIMRQAQKNSDDYAFDTLWPRDWRARTTHGRCLPTGDYGQIYTFTGYAFEKSTGRHSAHVVMAFCSACGATMSRDRYVIYTFGDDPFYG